MKRWTSRQTVFISFRRIFFGTLLDHIKHIGISSKWRRYTQFTNLKVALKCGLWVVWKTWFHTHFNLQILLKISVEMRHVWLNYAIAGETHDHPLSKRRSFFLLYFVRISHYFNFTLQTSRVESPTDAPTN